MSLQLITSPTQLAVSLTDAKKQVEIAESDTAHNDHLLRLIASATADVERHTRRAMQTQAWRLSLRDFTRRKIALPRPPLIAVTSITYVDSNGTTQTIASSNYQVSGEKPATVEPAYGLEWPTVRTETVDAVNINYTCGYGTECGSAPAELQNLVLELVAFRFFTRGDVEARIPNHIKWSMDSLRCGAMYDYYGVKS